jgi:hypothetical protein
MSKGIWQQVNRVYQTGTDPLGTSLDAKSGFEGKVHSGATYGLVEINGGQAQCC